MFELLSFANFVRCSTTRSPSHLRHRVHLPPPPRAQTVAKLLKHHPESLFEKKRRFTTLHNVLLNKSIKKKSDMAELVSVCL